MFYCEKCRVREGWPQSLCSSYGDCEVCGDRVTCHDVPSSKLPEREATGVKAISLTDRDREILNCIVRGWDKKSDHGIPGDVSYQDVFDVVEKLGLDKPVVLEEMINRYQRMTTTRRGK